MTGTSIAQAIPIAISPLLTRHYTPGAFGIFALYMAVTSIGSILVTGRYELAIMLPKKDSDAINIVALSIALSFVMSVALLLIVGCFSHQISQLLGSKSVATWLYFVPATTLLLGVYQSLNYWSNRKGHYKRMAISRMMQSSSGSTAQLAGGYAGLDGIGLVSGRLMGQALATALLGRLIYREDKTELKRISQVRIAAIARKFSDFPRYLVVAHGLNTASSQMPLILLGSFFSPTVAGFYMLTQRVIAAPMTIVASAIGDVFRQEASHAYAHNGNCKAVYVRALRRLIGISLIPFATFFFLAPNLFAFVFGTEWRTAGEYAKILTPMFLLRFVTNPLSQMDVIAQKQKLDLAWQIALFALIVASLMAGHYRNDVRLSLILFSAAYCVMYMTSGVISYWLSCGKGSRK